MRGRGPDGRFIRQRGNPGNTTHGLYRSQRVLQIRGLEALDPASPIYAAVAERRQAIIADLGGQASVTEAQRMLVEHALWNEVLIQSVTAWLAQRRSIVSYRSRALLPVVMQRKELVREQRELLATLGLSRKAKAKTLDQYVQERYGGDRPPALPSGGA